MVLKMEHPLVNSMSAVELVSKMAELKVMRMVASWESLMVR